MSIYLSKIEINQSRNIRDFEINLKKDERKHIILTGKNGSGKTSLLIEITKFLSQVESGNIQHYEGNDHNVKSLQKTLKDLPQYNDITQPEKYEKEKLDLEKRLKNSKDFISIFGGTKLVFSKSYQEVYNKIQKGEFILAYFEAKRHASMNVPSGINKFDLKKKYGIQENVNNNFLQYLVNLKADRSFARDDGEDIIVQEIDNWFKNIEKRLKHIFNVDNLELKFNRKNYNFNIILDDKEIVNFNTLSDGYSSIISIISEIILRMEAHELKSYNLEGIVIIDEIETHLHVDLQKKILPFLTDFFPKIQFIVSTHSPFVLSSISNCVVCDLERKITITDLSNYSYDALIESYFKTDKYSEKLKDKLNQYEILMNQIEISSEEKEKLKNLRDYLYHSPKYLSPELTLKLQQIELQKFKSKKED